MPRVFTIPAGVPFLPTLAKAVLDGTFAPLGDDPLALADVTILLPTRRSVRALRDAFAALRGPAIILPVIRPIGDVDEEDHLLSPEDGIGGERLLLPPALSPLDERLALTRLTLAWGRAVRRDMLQIYDDEPVLIPTSAANSALLARDLGRLLADMETAGIPWEAVRDLAPGDHARYFEITLDFLRIATEHWPAFLAERGRVGAVARRNQLIRMEAERLKRGGARGPVIAAGSTGSIPATAELLAVIAGLDAGAVVLRGLDQDIDDATWSAIGEPGQGQPADSHPQFGLKQLIGAIGIDRHEVVPLGTPTPALDRRARLIGEALRPAETTEAWASFSEDDVPTALSGVELLVARHEQEEALATAIAIREALRSPGTTIALVTPDRALARRTAIELGRWKLAVDDSAGQPLDRTAAGTFARLLVEAASSAGDPLKLLALLKHPLAAFGMARADCRRAARALELALFRGWRVAGGVANLPAALAKSRTDTATKRHIHSARRGLADWDWDRAAKLADALPRILGPIEAALGGREPISLASAGTLLTDALAAATDEGGGGERSLVEPDGAALLTLLAALGGEGGTEFTIEPSQFADFLTVLMGETMVQRPVGADPRVHIWGALEARLQSVDLLILGGLDEGVWPSATRTDPWLSRTMRAEIGLPPPERRVGLAAHDFAEAFASPRVVLTRAEKRGGAPTVASRWLQRLLALVGDEAAAELTARGARLTDIARDIDRIAAAKVTPVRRPRPTPPLAARPRSLRITEVETLVRDPYVTYAKRILGLEPLDPIGRVPDYALRGSLMHGALGDFTASWKGSFDAEALRHLRAIGETVLAEVADFPDSHVFWSLRFEAIARWFIGWEASRTDGVVARHAEVDGALEVASPGGPFKLFGRADRIDRLRDGSLAVFDFKTGSAPTSPQVLSGMSPQLGLESAMASRGAFKDIPPEPVAELAWIALSRAARDANDAVRKANSDRSPDAVGDKVLEEFMALIAAFDGEAHPYLSRTRPMFEQRYISPYDHLARVREWTLVESKEDEFWFGGLPVKP